MIRNPVDTIVRFHRGFSKKAPIIPPGPDYFAPNALHASRPIGPLGPIQAPPPTRALKQKRKNQNTTFRASQRTMKSYENLVGFVRKHIDSAKDKLRGSPQDHASPQEITISSNKEKLGEVKETTFFKYTDASEMGYGTGAFRGSRSFTRGNMSDMDTLRWDKKRDGEFFSGYGRFKSNPFLD